MFICVYVYTVKIDSILKSSIFKHLTGWGGFPSSFRKLFNCPKEQSTGEFSPDTSSRFSLSKLNSFIHVESSGDSPSSMHIKTAAEKIAKMTAKHIVLLLLPLLQLRSFQSELYMYSLRDLQLVQENKYYFTSEAMVLVFYISCIYTCMQSGKPNQTKEGICTSLERESSVLTVLNILATTVYMFIQACACVFCLHMVSLHSGQLKL